MKNLKQYVESLLDDSSLMIESLLDDEDVIANDPTAIIINFIETNYKLNHASNDFKIKEVKGKYIVSCRKKYCYLNKEATSITNGLFEWAKIQEFNCKNCQKLKSLEGAPKICKRFDCSNCSKLKSLEGAPEECDWFCCKGCEKLESLEGAPKECDTFVCSECKKLESLEGAPEECESFFCDSCTNLLSFKGLPTSIKSFHCIGCLKASFKIFMGYNYIKLEELNVDDALPYYEKSFIRAIDPRVRITYWSK